MYAVKLNPGSGCLAVLCKVHMISWEAESKHEVIAESQGFVPTERDGAAAASVLNFGVTLSAHWNGWNMGLDLGVQERCLWLDSALAEFLSLGVLWMHGWHQCLRLGASFCLYKHKFLLKYNWREALVFLSCAFSLLFFFHFLAITDRLSGPCPDD